MSRKMIFRALTGFMFITLSFTLSSTSFAYVGEWTTKADMPTRRSWFSTSVVNGKIYTIGGWSEISAVEEYNPMTNTWIKKADLPVARAYLTTCVVDGKIYAIGGSDSTGRGRVEQYDPATDQWTRKADLLTGRSFLDTSVVNGKIYAIGGNSWGGTTAIVEEYDPATDSWVRKADMPTARYTLSTSVIDGKIYAIGGCRWDIEDGVGFGTAFSAVEEYDPATDTWTAKAALPMPTYEHATVVVNGMIYVMGGSTLTENPGGDQTILSTIMKYDPVTDTWTKEGDMRSPRTAHSASVVAGMIYVIGGLEVLVKPISTVEAYQAAPSGFAYNPNPVDGAIHLDTWANLSWSPGDFATSHDVYLGENFNDVNEGLGNTFRGNQTATFISAGFPGSVYPDGLVRGATYYWRIDEVNDTEPNSPWKGPVWSFTIEPEIAYNPTPADGTEFVNLDVELSWTAGFDAALHTVYFGDNFNDINNATGGLQQKVTTYTPGPLEFGKTYYWRIDELIVGRSTKTHKGDIWSFTTIDFLVVDDFEDYDIGNNEIWWSWKDGLGYIAHDNEPTYSGNGSGSIVGDENTNSYCEETIVHGGKQSMPLAYDNNKQGYSNYSEVEMTLSDLRNWTVEGLGVLTIWFHGAASNSAESLYVVLNGNAVVTHDNSSATQIETWTQWDIDLQEFADQDIDMTDVHTIGLGFGDRNNPQPGGSGKMYFDDIRLHR